MLNLNEKHEIKALCGFDVSILVDMRTYSLISIKFRIVTGVHCKFPDEFRFSLYPPSLLIKWGLNLCQVAFIRILLYLCV